MKLASAVGCVRKLCRASEAMLRCTLVGPRQLPALCQCVLDWEVQHRACSLRQCTLEEFLGDVVGLEGVQRMRFNLPLLRGARAVSLGETLALCSLVSAVRASAVFEFGTYRGWTSSVLASCMEQGGRLLTLELPPGHKAAGALERRDVYDLLESEVGQAFKAAAPDRARVIQLWGDSALFDFSPWRHTVDLVFIDGAHTEEYVRNDTVRALGLVRPGGLVVWHDLKHSCPGVVRFLLQLGEGRCLYHIEDTSLVVYRASG